MEYFKTGVFNLSAKTTSVLATLTELSVLCHAFYRCQLYPVIA